MTVQEAKQLLGRAKNIDMEINALMQKRDEAFIRATGRGAIRPSERVQTSCINAAEKNIKWDLQPEQLKPCPCCGGKARSVQTKDFNYVFCTECELTTTTYDTEKEAADVWNRRVNND